MNSTKPEQVEANSPEGAADNQELIETQNKLIAELKQLNDQLQQEIAERKKKEQELQAQNTLVDGLLDAAVDTIEIFDPNDMSYLKWNITFNKFTGYSDEENSEMDPVADLIEEADIPKTKPPMRPVWPPKKAQPLLMPIPQLKAKKPPGKKIRLNNPQI